jgi:hypothetical protein
MHFFAQEYYEQLTQKPCRLMPYGWSPTLLSTYLLKNNLEISCNHLNYDKALTLCCFEPNLNVTKTCQCPLLMMNSFYLKNPDRVQKCFVFCAKQLLEHKSFTDFISFLQIYRDNKIEFYPRMAMPDLLSQMKEKELNPVIIGHQIYNDQNYMSLEALHLGYPLVHNSPSLRNAGFFYPEFNLHSGVTQLETISSEFHKIDFNASYRVKCRKTLADNSTSSPILLEELKRLLV